MKDFRVYFIITVFAASFAFVTLYTYGSTTISTNISTGGTLTVSGDATFDTNTLFVDSTNNRVGIGTTSPQALLGMQGAIGVNSSQLYLAANGNVGIGTSTPHWLTQINGAKPSLAISDSGASTNNKHWLFSSMGGKLYIGTSTDLYATSTPPAITVLNNGNVGIGIVSPNDKLDVAGNIGVSGTNAQFTIDSTGSQIPDPDYDSITEKGITIIGDTDTGIRRSIVFRVSGSETGENPGTGGIRWNHFSSTDFYLYRSAASGGSYGGDLRLDFNDYIANPDDYTPIMTVVGNKNLSTFGDVGFGTTSPRADLHVTATSTTATTTLQIGSLGNSKGTCLKMYSATGTAIYCYFNGANMVCNTTSCE